VVQFAVHTTLLIRVYLQRGSLSTNADSKERYTRPNPSRGEDCSCSKGQRFAVLRIPPQIAQVGARSLM
jgi:hypothetical protein